MREEAKKYYEATAALQIKVKELTRDKEHLEQQVEASNLELAKLRSQMHGALTSKGILVNRLDHEEPQEDVAFAEVGKKQLMTSRRKKSGEGCSIFCRKQLHITTRATA